jgi:hypothetical protein
VSWEELSSRSFIIDLGLLLLACGLAVAAFGACGGDDTDAQRLTQRPPNRAARLTRAPAGTSSCGGGDYVNSVTTCPFAQNIQTAYNQSGGGDTTVEAYSTATGRTFLMTCSGSSPHVCYGGNNARVYFP